MTSPPRSMTALPPSTLATCRSAQSALCTGSPPSDGTSKGRSPDNRDSSATRAERLDERTAEKVATARTNVPPAVAGEEIVCQLSQVATLAP